MHTDCEPKFQDWRATAASTAVLPNNPTNYFLDAACFETPDAAPRDLSFEGYMRRFVRRHDKTPTARLEDLLREAYRAGVADGATMIVRLRRKSAAP